MSLDPTVQGHNRWVIRWKGALNAVFDGQLTAGRN